MAKKQPAGVILKRDETPLRAIILFGSDDHMKAFLLLLKKNDSVTIQPEEITAILADAGVCNGVMQERVDRALQASLRGEQKVGPLLVAEGVEPTPGVSGHVSYQNPPTGKVKGAAANSGEAVDYKEVRTFSNVVAGDTIGVYYPPIPGVAGTDVYDRIIPTSDVDDVSVRAGAGVRYDEETKTFSAEQHGHVELQGDVLSVSDVLSVRGDLDMHLGNVHFVGRVELGGDVPDDFEVSGDEGVLIRGVAEACVLESKSDIVVRGGVSGKGKGRISCAGMVRANFLDGVNVEADGDVIVEREIVNSQVHTLGRLLVPKGVIIGSNVVALKGVFSKQVGSDLGIPTTVGAGVDFHLLEQIGSLHEDLAKLTGRQRRYMQSIGPMLENALQQSSVGRGVRTEIDEQWQEIERLQRRIRKLEKESDELSEDYSAQAVERIEIDGIVYPGSALTVGRYSLVVSSALKGPLTVSADNDLKRADLASGISEDNSIIAEAPLPPVWERKQKVGGKE